MAEERIHNVFDSFIDCCSEQDLDFIIANELSRAEKEEIIKNRDTETQENILENYPAFHS